MTKYIDRLITSKIEESVKFYPVITITGPRQAGKSTLCRHLFPDYKYISMERIPVRTAAMQDPEKFMDMLGNKVIIDEVQHVPDLLSEIQCRVDENQDNRYVLTGSSNFSLLKNVTQSLAGRTSLFTLLPFSEEETKAYCDETETDTILYNGCYPGVLVKGIDASTFYANYYDTYVERDLRNLLNVSNIAAFDKFVHLLALRVGTEFNATAISREVGVSAITISEWMSILETSYIAFRLQPYYSNPGKRLTKTPKIYFYDTGLLTYLMNVDEASQMAKFPYRGQIFENYVVAEMMKKEANLCKRNRLYYYREVQGLEVDIVRQVGAELELYEVKSGKSYQSDFQKNMKSLSERMPEVRSRTLVYDGATMSPEIINFRDL